MNNAERFRQVFGIYATELWVMSEEEFLKWLNADAPKKEFKVMTESEIQKALEADDGQE